MRGVGWITGLVVLGAITGCQNTSVPAKPIEPEEKPAPVRQAKEKPGAALQKATLGGGCFWCTESVYLQLGGVKSVVSGFSGGTVANPTYKQVCEGDTGHAECVQITFDPEVISYEQLLDIFFQTHDPTTLNRQGNDVGTHYRSVIFTHSDEQKKQAEQFKAKLGRDGVHGSPIVTQIAPFTVFYPAEDYHQDFFAKNPGQPYCLMTIPAKLNKVKKQFGDLMKK